MSYKFVLITDEYIDYLRKTEPRVIIFDYTTPV